MVNQNVIDIDALLALDLAEPANALAFRRGIAELAGWREIHDDWDTADNPLGPYGIHPKYHQDIPVSAFETSVDAALTLPLEEGHVIRIIMGVNCIAEICDLVVPDDWKAEDGVDMIYKSFSIIGHAEGKHPALAVCRAWLRYRAAQSARATEREGMTSDG